MIIQFHTLTVGGAYIKVETSLWCKTLHNFQVDIHMLQEDKTGPAPNYIHCHVAKESVSERHQVKVLCNSCGSGLVVLILSANFYLVLILCQIYFLVNYI